MKLDCVLTATNDNPMYVGFIPMFVQAWKKLYPDTDVKIIFVGEKIPADLDAYEKHLILFPPIQGVSTAFISQYIRLLYPALMDYEEGILITDMDIIPMNRTYYSQPIEALDKDTFVYWERPATRTPDQIAMCYNVARNTTWREIFNITDTDEITARLKSVYEACSNWQGYVWDTDQLHLYQAISNWPNVATRFKVVPWMGEGRGTARLDRGRDNPGDPATFEAISSGYYADYHAKRPYQQYKAINDQILSLLP